MPTTVLYKREEHARNEENIIYKKKLACNFIRRFLVLRHCLITPRVDTEAVTAVAAPQLTPLPQLVLKNQFSWADRFNDGAFEGTLCKTLEKLHPCSGLFILSAMSLSMQQSEVRLFFAIFSL